MRSKPGQKNLEQNKLQWDWGGGNPWDLTKTLTLERLQKWNFLFFPQYLYVWTIFLGPYRQQELDDEVTLPISHRHLLQKKSKETKPLRNPLCLRRNSCSQCRDCDPVLWLPWTPNFPFGQKHPLANRRRRVKIVTVTITTLIMRMEIFLNHEQMLILL